MGAHYIGLKNLGLYRFILSFTPASALVVDEAWINFYKTLKFSQNLAKLPIFYFYQGNSGEFRRCFLIFDFINVVVRLRPEFDTDGNLIKKHYLGFYWFFQDEVLRYLYDTFRTVERLADAEK